MQRTLDGNQAVQCIAPLTAAMDLAASVGGAAAATIAGVIGLVAAANKRRSQRASTRDSVVFSDRSSRPTIDDPAPAQTTMVATTSWPPLRDGQLVALWYDERLVHATNAPRGAVASLSEYECGGEGTGFRHVCACMEEGNACSQQASPCLQGPITPPCMHHAADAEYPDSAVFRVSRRDQSSTMQLISEQ